MLIGQTGSCILSQRSHIVRYVWLFNKDFCTVLNSLTLSISTDRKYVLCQKISSNQITCGSQKANLILFSRKLHNKMCIASIAQ